MKALRFALGFGDRHRRGLALAALLGALASGAAVALAAVSAWLIARASQQPPVLHLMVAIVSVRAFGASRGIFRYLERLVSHSTSFRILGDLRSATVARLERLLPDRREGPDALSTGELLARFVGDVDRLQDLWARVVVPTASAVVVGAGAVVLVGLLAPLAGLVLAASLVVAAVAAPLLGRRAARGAGGELAPLRGRYQGELLEVLDGATELAVYDRLDERLTDLDAVDAALARAEARTAGATGLGVAIAALAGGLATVAALGFGAQEVAAGRLAPINLAVVALVPLAVHEVVAALSVAAHRLPELAGSARRLEAVFQRPDAVTDPDTPRTVPEGPLGVRVRRLTAGWSADRGPVLVGLDLDLAPGTVTLVVGPSGSGKSTLAAVLLRFLEPDAGSVELVGEGAVDVRELASDAVRAEIGWCAQDAHLFDSTIEANLRLAGPDATLEQLRAALAGAQLLAWVDSLPNGLATMVGEHGRQLSGGQRQRLALTRV
ncbi:MAG: thiol reductant ABC exporter subunit CydC, partial [Actinomycetota bacterium]